MALTATMRRFEIALADTDRGVYETLDLRAAQHPSESERYLVARVLARVLEDGEGVEFTRGLAVDDEPAIWQRDLRGDLVAWIEVGAPSVDRLHKAQKTGARVAVYGWNRVEQLAADAIERKVYKVETLGLWAFEPAFLDAVAATLDRNNKWELSITGGVFYLTCNGVGTEGGVRQVHVEP